MTRFSQTRATVTANVESFSKSPGHGSDIRNLVEASHNTTPA